MLNPCLTRFLSFSFYVNCPPHSIAWEGCLEFYVFDQAPP